MSTGRVDERRQAMASCDRLACYVGVDPIVHDLVKALCRAAQWRFAAFERAADYVAASIVEIAGCVVVDVDLAEAGGLDPQRQIADIAHPPVVVVADRADVRASVRAIKAGAVDFLVKPVRGEDLARAMDAALRQDRDTREARAHLHALRLRYARLSPRERQVLALVVAGRLNKQAAAELGISEATLQIHRRSVMRKSEVRSLADLVRMATALGLPLPAPRVDSRTFSGWRLPSAASDGPRNVGRALQA
jgi:FixJ family two-component response regulator